MKKIFKGAFIVVAALTFSGCITTQAHFSSIQPFQGKVWRAEIKTQFVNTVTPTPAGGLSDEFLKTTHYDETLFLGIPMTRIVFREGIDHHYMNAAVPDHIALEDIRKGAILDVLVVKGSEVDFRTWKINRVVRVVCKAGDRECRRKLDNVNSVVDENPGDGSKYNLTFSRRITTEDFERLQKQ